jgi:UDPglucose 6-dehydrogenase
MTKSTVPVGTGKRIEDIISSLTDVEYDYVSNPEFLKEGSAVKDFLYPERVVIGCESDRAFKRLSHLYRPFMRRSNRVLRADVASAELAKYACNSMLAVRISFMNELAQLAEQVGADIDLVRQAMGSDSRIGGSFLFPGLGYGGSCFPKDVQALVHSSDEYGTSLGIVKAAHDANNRQISYFFEKIKNYWNGSLRGKRIGVWGLAFKPRTDDVRDSPAIKIITRLLEHGVEVHVHDPEALETTRAILGDRVTYGATPYQVVDGADALVVCTEWLEYRTPDFAEVAKLMAGKIIFDGRNIYDRELLSEYKLEHYRVG